jgi:hypothetical protein
MLAKSYDTDFELGKIAGKLVNEGNGQTIGLDRPIKRSSQKREDSRWRELASSTSKLGWIV